MAFVEEPKEGPVGLQLIIGVGIGVVLAAIVATSLTLARGHSGKAAPAASASVAAGVGSAKGPAGAEGPSITIADPDAVTAIEITRAKEATIKLERKDGRFRMTAPVDSWADADGVAALLAATKTWALGASVPAAEADKAFAEERVHVVFRRGDAAPLEVSIGGESAVSPKLRIVGQSGTWDIVSFPKALLSKDQVDWRDHAVVRIDPDTVDRILIENPHGTFELTKTPQGFRGGRSAATADFDPARANELLVAIKSLDALGFAEAGADTGLDKPTLFGGQIKVFKKGSTEPVVLSFGKAGKGGRFASVSGSNDVFIVSGWVADWAMADATKFAKK